MLATLLAVADGTEPAVGVWFVIEECLPRR